MGKTNKQITTAAAERAIADIEAKLVFGESRAKPRTADLAIVDLRRYS